MNENIKNSIDNHLSNLTDKVFYEAPETSSIPLLSNIIGHETSCVFEIGANDGADIISIHQQWPGAEIHAFEIEPFHYPRLLRFISEYIHINFFGLYNYNGTVSFHRMLQNGVNWENSDYWIKSASSIRKGKGKTLDCKKFTDQKIYLNVLTIDDYCELFKCKPDILLIDTQGSEYEILQGAHKTLSNIKGIILEWSNEELYENIKLYGDIEKLLVSYGFTLKEKINLWGDWHGDAVFVKNEKTTN